MVLREINKCISLTQYCDTSEGGKPPWRGGYLETLFMCNARMLSFYMQNIAFTLTYYFSSASNCKGHNQQHMKGKMRAFTNISLFYTSYKPCRIVLQGVSENHDITVMCGQRCNTF